MKQYEVTLDRGEQQVATVLATGRHHVNRKRDIANKRIGPQSDELTDLEGIAAEMAFCRIMNFYPDLGLEPRSGGFDCQSPSGITIDVKTTTYPSGMLLAVGGKKLDDADVYVLMIGKFPTYTWVGWAEAAELLDRNNIKDLGHGPTYALEQHRLHEPNIRLLLGM